MTAAVVLGLLIGLLLGLLGGGGSILAVPALVYGASMPLAAAIPTSLIVVGISSAVAVLPRRKLVQWRLAGVFAGTGAAAAFAGAAVNHRLHPTVVLLGFSALMIVAGIQLLRDRGDVGGACALPAGAINWRSCLPKAISAGLGVGFLTGLFGVGGGFLIIPALVVLLGLPMATSLVVISVNSAAGLTAHLSTVTIDYPITTAFTIAAISGSLLAGRLATRLPADRLRRWFAYLVLAVALYITVQTSSKGMTGMMAL